MLAVDGATCVNCALAIEHAGRRIAGIHDLRYERGEGRLYLSYDGKQETIDAMVNVVQRLGYDAATLPSA